MAASHSEVSRVRSTTAVGGCGGTVDSSGILIPVAARKKKRLAGAGGLKKRRSGAHHSVYVVELARDVLLEPKFRRSNPGYDPAKPCVYVGMTGLSPDVRFDKHKAGIQSNRFVRLYGLRLLPELYEYCNPMPYEAARDMEVEMAIGLQEEGYGVWQG